MTNIIWTSPLNNAVMELLADRGIIAPDDGPEEIARKLADARGRESKGERKDGGS